MNFKMILTPAISVLILAACADGNYRPYNLDDKFGQTAKQMVNASIADPKAAKNPPANSPRKMDGYAGVYAIGAFRNSFSQNVQPQGLTINVGSGGSGGSGGQ